MNTDWKDALGQLRGSLPEGEEPAATVPAGEPHTDPSSKRKPKDKLHIALEKKGRGGKTATIVYGFTCSDDELQATASLLKKRLGTGGSARGGEILIQGDRRDDVAAELRRMGLMQ